MAKRLAPAVMLMALLAGVLALGKGRLTGDRSDDSCPQNPAAVASRDEDAERLIELLPTAGSLAREGRPDAALRSVFVAWSPVPLVSFLYSGQDDRPPILHVEFREDGPHVVKSDFAYPHFRDNPLDLGGLEIGADAVRTLVEERYPGFSAVAATLRRQSCDLGWRVLAVVRQGQGSGMELQVDVHNPGREVQAVEGYPVHRQILP